VVSTARTQRIADRIREELSEMLIQEVSDPRLVGISITDVRIDRELAYATIFISALEGSSRWDEIKDGLDHASGFLRHELTQRIDLRSFPRLRFRWDPTVEKAERIEHLLATIHREEQQVAGNVDNATEDAGDQVTTEDADASG
jgi:ribosome-binding factor A